MRKIFTPEEVAAWTQKDLDDLVGKYVAVEVPASEWFKEHCGGDWEGGTGNCISATALGDQTIDIEWDYGMGWRFKKEDRPVIAVCDEHGDHTFKQNFDGKDWTLEDDRDPGAAECLRTLGVRGLEEGEQENASNQDAEAGEDIQEG